MATTLLDADIKGYKLLKKQQDELDLLLKSCHEHMDTVDDDLVSRAFKLTYLSHEGATRASGEPYYRDSGDVAG